MLYIGYLINLDGKNGKVSVLEISIFGLPRLVKYINTSCPKPLGSPPTPPWTPK